MYVFVIVGFSIVYLIYLMVKTPKKRGGKICAHCSKTHRNSTNSFHKFPHPVKENRRFRAWCSALKKVRLQWTHPYYEGKPPSTCEGCVICSDHFTLDQYYPPKKANKRPSILKKTAVPTIFRLREKPHVQQRGTRNSAENNKNVSDICFYDIYCSCF